MALNKEALNAFLERDKARKASGYSDEGGVKYYRISDDKENYIRVLELGTFVMGQHWGVLAGKDGKKGQALRCPQLFDGSACPICETADQLRSSASKEDQKRAKDIEAKERYPMTVLDLTEDGEMSPRVFEAPKTVFYGTVSWINNPKYGDVTDYQSGRNLTLIKKTENNYTKYEVQPDPDRSKVEVDPSRMPNLREALKPLSYEDLEYALVNGRLPENSNAPRQEAEAPPPPQTREPEPGPRRPTTYGKGFPGPKAEGESQPETQIGVKTPAVTSKQSIRDKLAAMKGGSKS